MSILETREMTLLQIIYDQKDKRLPGGTGAKNLPANARDTGSIPSLGRFHILWCNEVRVAQYWASPHNYWNLYTFRPSRHSWVHVPQLLKPAHARASKSQLLNPCAATAEAVRRVCSATSGATRIRNLCTTARE